MTPKEKAKELVDKFYKYSHDGSNGSYYDTIVWTKNSKQCALIAVDENIKNMQQYEKEIEDLLHVNLAIYSAISYNIEYLEDVKQEIEKL